MVNIGIDVGSTTVKIIVLRSGELLYKDYTRHNAQVRQTILDLVQAIEPLIKDEPITVAVAGSAGMGVANDANLAFVQEVIAATKAIDQFYPETKVAIELGGEDAKIIFFGDNIDQRMNGTCAGGTGAFIDQMATLLDISADDLNDLAKGYQQIYPIASRCGVFAKTDIQPLLNQGVAKADIPASIMQAIVNQTLGGLAQGKKIDGKVILLGGPLHFFSELRLAFKRTLNLSDQDLIFPKNAQYFVALGTALESVNNQPITLAKLISVLESIKEVNIRTNNVNPLFASRADYQKFVDRQAKHDIIKQDISTYRGRAYLGIDAGSTTTKIVLIGENNELLHEFYTGNRANPIEVIRAELTNIYNLVNEDTTIHASCVTGYGEELIKHAFMLDFGVVETFAHFKAASFFNPNVDYIIDIGGQDMKCFKIKNDTIDSIMLNEACSSGCGSFIETFAKALGYTVEEFAEMALFAKNPAELGSRCTVFMNSSVKQAQKDGATVEDVAAGIATSVVKNALYKVIRVKDASELGENIIVQGGTFYNDAVLAAFERELNKEVIRPSIAGLMGAFGCALIAKEKQLEAQAKLNKEVLIDFTYQSRSTNCSLCANNCLLTISLFGKRRFISGNRCERGAGLKPITHIPNVFNEYYEKLLKIPTVINPKRGNVGIPLVLNYFDTYPFWASFFETLGIQVVLSDKTTKELYFSGQQTIPSDTVCYPAKVVHGHVLNLLDKKVDKIFYPINVYNFKEKAYVDNNYNCPIVAYYPELLEANIDELNSNNFISPYISMGTKTFKQNVYYALKKHYPDLSLKEIDSAIKNAYQSYYKFKEEIEVLSEVAIKYAKENDLKVICLAGRPYHTDPGISHGIDKVLITLGAVVIPEQGIATKASSENLKVLNQWTYHSRLYDAANFVAKQKNMELVQLVSFGCGLDAVTADETRRILELNNKFYTQIKIDEISNLGAAKIRIRSLLASMEEKGKANRDVN